MSNYLSTDCYDEDGRVLTLYFVENADGDVHGIYGDEDFACQNADTSAGASGEPADDVLTVREVIFTRSSERIVFEAKAEAVA